MRLLLIEKNIVLIKSGCGFVFMYIYYFMKLELCVFIIIFIFLMFMFLKYFRYVVFELMICLEVMKSEGFNLL